MADIRRCSALWPATHGDRWALGSRLPCQLPLRIGRDQLPRIATSAVSVAELLVPVRRGAVLRRLSLCCSCCRGEKSRKGATLTARTVGGRLDGSRRCLALVVRRYKPSSIPQSPTSLRLPGRGSLPLGPWSRRARPGSDVCLSVGCRALLGGSRSITVSRPSPLMPRPPTRGRWSQSPSVARHWSSAGVWWRQNGGAEWSSDYAPFGGSANCSYSLYLWHWPILIIVAESTGRAKLPTDESLALVGFALGLSWVTFRFVENPIRHVRLPSRQSVILGLTLVAATVVLLTALIAAESTTGSGSVAPAPSNQTVLAKVAAAPAIMTLPHRLTPSLSNAPTDWGGGDSRAVMSGHSRAVPGATLHPWRPSGKAPYGSLRGLARRNVGTSIRRNRKRCALAAHRLEQDGMSTRHGDHCATCIGWPVRPTLCRL